MRGLRQGVRRKAAGLALSLSLITLCTGRTGLASPRNDKAKIPGVTWDESHPGCTFSRSEDGKYHYGMWYEDVGVTLAVDSQEVEKVHRRHEPFFAVLLDVRYRGQGSLDVATDNISLEFVKHFQVVQTCSRSRRLSPKKFRTMPTNWITRPRAR